MGGCQKNHSKQTYACHSDLGPCFFHYNSFLIFSHPPLPGAGRETHLQLEVSLINANFSYKNVTSGFSELSLCLLFLEK